MAGDGSGRWFGAITLLLALVGCSGGAAESARIAFVSERDGNREVRLVDLAGAEQRLTQDPADDYPAAVAPDGSGVLVVSVAPVPRGTAERLVFYPADQGEPRQIGPRSARTRNPSWSPDARWLVFEADVHSFRDLYRMDRDGRNLRRLTNNRQGNFEPEISPDGQWIAFVSSRDDNAEVYRMRADGSQVQRLTAFHRDDWAPRWSPDGRQLAFVSNREGEDRIFLINADGTGIRRLTRASPTAGVLEGNVAWSPDARRIAYVAEPRQGRPRIRIADTRTGAEKAIPAGDAGGESDPAWSPDGRSLALVSDRDGDPEIYLADTDGGALRRITQAPGADWLPRWVPTRRVSARR